MAVYNFAPSLDGQISLSESSGEPWSYYRAATSGSAVFDELETVGTAIRTGSNAEVPWIQVTVAHLHFDTSQIQPETVIANAYIEAVPFQVTDPFGGERVVLVAGQATNDGSLVVGDFNETNTDLLSDYKVPLSTLPTNQPYRFYLNTQGVAAINRGGVSKFAFILESWRTGVEPSSPSLSSIASVAFYASENLTSSSFDPVLTIETTSDRVNPSVVARPGTILELPFHQTPTPSVLARNAVLLAVESLDWTLNPPSLDYSPTFFPVTLSNPFVMRPDVLAYPATLNDPSIEWKPGLPSPLRVYPPVHRVKEDSNPYQLVCQLRDGAESPIDLNRAVGVDISIFTEGGGTVVANQPVTIDEVSTSTVKYTVSPSDIATAGRYLFEFRVEWEGSDYNVVPTDRQGLLIVSESAIP